MSILAVILVGMAVGLLAAVWRNVRRRPPNVPGRPRTVVRRRIRTEDPHWLYHYDHALRPGRIYIGISNCPDVRDKRHSVDPDDQWWMRRSTGVMVIDREYPNRRAAFAAERMTIREAWYAGEDIANDQHVPKGARRAVRR